jgi:4-hydroxy-tetrahydrodipicolinate reductase
MTIRALLVGNGKMGTLISQLAPQHDVTIVQVLASKDSFQKALEQPLDVIIDFSSAGEQKERTELALNKKIPIVIGTTGWDEHKESVAALCKKNGGAVCASANFSIGVAIFKKLVLEATTLLGRFDEYDISLLEKHHRLKKDHPSGTGKELMELVLEKAPHKKRALFELEDGKIDSGALQVASVRCGSIVGEHELLFDGPDDTIELTHRAKNRNGFAQGALFAAKWIIGKTGFFTMDDML